MADQLIAGIAPVFDDGGNIVAGGSVTFYETGTTTLVTIYSDQAATTPMTNPVTLDAAGRPPQIFYTGAVAVKEVIKDAAGVTIDTIDPSPRFSTQSSAADGVSFSPIGSNPNTNVQAAIAAVSTSLASFSNSPVAAVAGTANALSLTTGKSLTSVATGQRLSFIGALDNTGAMTVAVDGLPAKAIKTVTCAAAPAKYVRAGVLTEMHYDGAQWIADRLVERVSGANGTAYRYADGSQKCTHIVTLTGGGSPSISGTWTFPLPFALEPSMQFSSFGAPPATYRERSYWQGSGTASRTINISMNVNFPASTSEQVYATALGDWFA